MEIKPNPNAVKMIQELSDAKAPSGFEDEAVAVARKYSADFADASEDCLRNLYLHAKSNTAWSFRLCATAIFVPPYFSQISSNAS